MPRALGLINRKPCLFATVLSNVIEEQSQRHHLAIRTREIQEKTGHIRHVFLQDRYQGPLENIFCDIILQEVNQTFTTPCRIHGDGK